MTNTPMTSREAFNEYIRDGKHIFFDDMDEAYALWQASEAQQAQTIAELVEALDFMERHTAIYPAHPKRVATRALIAKVKGK